METVNLKHLLSGFQPILMISKNKIKQIKSLARKKFRQKEQLFLAEGDKIVLEVLNSDFRIAELYATEKFLAVNKNSVTRAEICTEVTSEEIKKASLLKQPQNCLAICQLPPVTELPDRITGFSFFLDGIQDPGNLGTIIRISDWFGVEYLFCSPDTADIYNPKVIQASMASFCRVKCFYTDFNYIASLAESSEIPVYGTFLEGNNIFGETLPGKAIIVLGNEGRGIRTAIADKIAHKLSIPSFSRNNSGAESLNVAVAAGIICSEFRRKNQNFSIQNEN